MQVRKVLAVASAGGHWVQLLRLRPGFIDQEVTFMSTKESFEDTVKGHTFYYVEDASRWDKFKLLSLFLKIYRLVSRIKPDVIITTGAAPGLIAIIVGKVLGIRTIWIDSIANVEKISLSGRIALSFATRVYTQWPHLATTKVLFKGNVL